MLVKTNRYMKMHGETIKIIPFRVYFFKLTAYLHIRCLYKTNNTKLQVYPKLNAKTCQLF